MLISNRKYVKCMIHLQNIIYYPIRYWLGINFINIAAFTIHVYMLIFLAREIDHEQNSVILLIEWGFMALSHTFMVTSG